MKQFSTLLAILVVFLLSSPSWSEGISFDDLVKLNGLMYKKFTDVPFTGELDEGLERGNFKNGKREGPWAWYFEDGQLEAKGDFSNGEMQGPWLVYYKTRKLRFKGAFKNGEPEGPHVWYFDDGKLWNKGDYKNGKMEGPWVSYLWDGSIVKEETGTFKNGKKISD